MAQREWARTGLIGPMQGAIPTQSRNLSREVGRTTGVYVPYSFRAVACVLLRSTWTDQYRKVLWDRICGFSSSSEKTRKSNRSQMSLQRKHFLLIYLKILSVGPAGVWTRDLPLRGPALYQLTELTRRRLINQDWSNIQSKNYGDNSRMSQECTEALCSFHVKGTKWNRKQIKPLIINAILFIFFEPAIVVNRYMTCALFNWILKKKLSFLKKNLSSEKKNLSFEKNPEFWKHLSSFKKSEFKKTLSFEKIWVFKKN